MLQAGYKVTYSIRRHDSSYQNLVGITLWLGHCLLFKTILVWDIPYVDTSREERVSLPHSSVHGILQARILEWVAISFIQGYRSGKLFPSPGGLPDRGIKPTSPALAGAFFTAEPAGKPLSVFKVGFSAFEMLTSVVSCHCSMFGRVPGLYPLIASSTHSSSL